MRIIYVHHALRQKGNPPSQDDKIQPLGIQDAETTAELLKMMSDKSKSTFKAIYTSPYYRCAKTAEIINETRKAPIVLDKALEERGFGEFEGKIRKEIHDEILDSEILDNYSLNREYKGVETIQNLCNRVWNLIDELKEDYTEKNILLVTHGGVTRAINGYFNEANEEGILEDLNLHNCEIRTFEIKE